MNASDGIRVRHMLDAAGEAFSFAQGDEKRLIHAYFDIDPDIVWDTTVRALPPLVEVPCDLLNERHEAI
jgi:hypothetical protein